MRNVFSAVAMVLGLGLGAAGAATINFVPNAADRISNGQSALSHAFSGPEFNVTVYGAQCFNDDGCTGYAEAAELKVWDRHGLSLQRGAGDDHRVDGKGRDDAVLLQFDRVVTLTGLGFSYAENGEHFSIIGFDGQREFRALDGTIGGVSGATGFGTAGFAGLTGSMFAVVAFGDDDAWKLLSATATATVPAAVPLPATGLLLAAAIGGIGAVRRRRRVA